MDEYKDFIDGKLIIEQAAESIAVEVCDLNEKLYDFQCDIVRWALAKGRAAIFADCGLGKTPMQLEWVRNVVDRHGGMVMILAPLAVASQTAAEGEKFGIHVTICETADDLRPGINITNYEKLQKFKNADFSGIVLDESSILKSFDGKVRSEIIETFQNTPFRLACTATPAPNDFMELGNHAEFLGIMTYQEMLSMYFVHDGGDTSKWRLKGHAEDAFWEWMAGWACVVENPRDLGYKADGYDLPELHLQEIVVTSGDEESAAIKEMESIARGKMTLADRRKARKDTLKDRCEAVADMANHSTEQWLVWCETNDESRTLHKLIPDSVEVTGSDKADDKAERMLGFSSGKYRVLVTKPSIAGFGMNWQNCHNMVFVGMSDSYEQYYQAIRRCWRFGQSVPVTVVLITSGKDDEIKKNVERKEQDAKKMRRAMAEKKP